MLSFKSNIDHTLSKLKSYRTSEIEPKKAITFNVPNIGNMSKYAQSQVMYTQPQFYSPLHTPQNWQIPSKRREQYMWCRYFCENEPKVGAAVNFYSEFCMNGFETQCQDSKIKKFFDHWNKKINLDKWNKMISKEYFMLGDVFPFAEVGCARCNGTSVYGGGKCEHEGAIFKRLVILNPDWIDVQSSSFADDPVITLIPDEELKRVVGYKQPKAIFDRIPQHIQKLILSGRPIPLSSESVSHIAYNASPYGGGYGSSMIRRLFKMLTYKDKLMTAQWIVAERLILPIRLVKVGDADRPAGASDIADIQAQLAQVSNDPNLTLVTHHAVDYDWIGASGKILQLSNEYELINKEILQGLMLNEAILSGEMSGYQSAAIGAETIIQRLESWRRDLARWIEEKLYKPISSWQKYIDKDATEDIGEQLGEKIYIYPKVKWNDLNIRDDTQQKQIWIQLHGSQVLSTQTLCEKMGLDYDQEIERQRFESAAMVFGQAAGAGQAGMGGGGGGMPGQEIGGGLDLGMGGAGNLGGEGAPGPSSEIGGASPDMGGAGVAPEMTSPAGQSVDIPAIGGTEGKILTKSRTKDKVKKEEQKIPEEQAVQPGGTKLTSLEQIMYKILTEINIPFKRYAQFTLGRYRADFAIPDLKLDIECDGHQWHANPEAKAHDKKRDMDLANAGWTVVRFNENELQENQQGVKRSVFSNIMKCWNRTKQIKQEYTKQIQATLDNLEVKYSSDNTEKKQIKEV